MAILRSSLPDDMVVEILCLLPVISLLRCKSVCKSWLSIISDPEFVQKHLHCCQIMVRKKASLLMFRRSQLSDDRPLLASPEFGYYLLDPKLFNVIGSCNGVICLVNGFCYLWNPSTNQGMILPAFPQVEKAVTNIVLSVKLAFGFDTISNDYKVLRFIFPTEPTTTIVPIVQIYSTNTSSWKVIPVYDTSVSKALCFWSFGLGPIINGVLYIGRAGKLVSFNLHDEVFTIVPFPSSMLRHSDILEFEESVAVIFDSVGDGSGMSLWTLDDIPGKVSWTKKFIVRDDIRWVYSYLGGGLMYGRKELMSYDILYVDKNREFKYSHIQANRLADVLKYTESLVSIKGFTPMQKLVPWIKPKV